MGNFNNQKTIDSYLISFCKGENDAIVTKYKEWLPEFYMLAYRYVKNQEVAEDTVADSFEKLLLLPLEKRKQKFIIEQINLKALMYVMIKNKCLDHLKILKNRNRIIDNIRRVWEVKSNNDSKKIFADENFENLLLCLPTRERLILKMNIDGYKHQEIGEKLNISEKTVSNTLSLSRSKIKKLWSTFME